MSEKEKSPAKCEWATGCRRKVTHQGFHWGRAFGLCSPCQKRAKKWYDTRRIDGKEAK